jgi:LSD1 subclass zinc finger protein
VPVYGILTCVSCHSRVLYSVGSSDFIKCTKCTTVNEVPSGVKEARGGNVHDPNYQVFFNKQEMQTEQTANPYIRDANYNKLEELLSEEEYNEKKYP